MDYSWLILTRCLSPDEHDRSWGGVQMEWDKLQSRIVEGDEVWEYECVTGRQHPLSGSSGVCLKRGNEIVCHVVVRQTFD